MKTASFISAVLASSAGLVSASSLEIKDGKTVCPKDLPNGAFCAGDSLGTDIIIRCTNGVAQAGRCGNNLVGQPPLGSGGARCWESAANSGVAACEKNCVVYGSSGTYDGDFTLPECKPSYTASAPASASATTPAGTAASSSADNTATSVECDSTEAPSQTQTQTQQPQQTQPPLSTGGTGTGNAGVTKTSVLTTFVTDSSSRLPVAPTSTSSVVVGGAMGRAVGGASMGALGLALGVIGLMF